MSMPELTDDQLDGLFRKSAEEFDPPFDPVAWRDMKTRLDANDRTTGGALTWNNLLRWGLPIALLLLLSVGGWYAYRALHPATAKSGSPKLTKGASTVKRHAEQLSTEIPLSTDNATLAHIPTVGPKESEAGKQPTDLPGSVAKPTEPENRFNKPETKRGAKAISTPPAATKRTESTYRQATGNRTTLTDSGLDKSANTTGEDVAASASFSLKRENSRVSSGRKQRKAFAKRYGTSFVTSNYAITSNSPFSKRPKSDKQTTTVNSRVDGSGNLSPIPVSGTENVALPALAELTIRPATWPKPLAFTSRAVTANPDTTARNVVPKLPSERGLSVRLVVAPDLSSIGLKNFSRPGTNIGALLEYRLAPRWSVQAGIIQSTKVYRALPQDYTAPYGTWGAGVYIKPENIENVDGRCNMFDIPINLRYDVRIRPQRDGRFASRWFVSGGVTSYIMKQEDYVYNYVPHPYPRPTTYEGHFSTGGYSFSNLNLSIGYERTFSKRLSWQVEPFVKAPLKGVGYFNINLISTGAFFSIRYKLTN